MLTRVSLSKDLVCIDDSANAEPLYKPSLCSTGMNMVGVKPCQVSLAKIKVDQEPLLAVQREAEVEEKAMVHSKSTRTWVTEASWKPG